jgi:paraquat-inducible protein B
LVDDPTIEEMPVLIQLDQRELVSNFPAAMIGEKSDGFPKAIARRLRASIRSSSLITGQMFVDLDYDPAAADEALAKRGKYMVLPTVASGLGRLEDKLAALLDKINGLGLDTLVTNVSSTSKQATTTLATLEDTLASDKGVVADAQKTLAEMTDAVASLNTLLKSEETKAIPADLRETLANLNATLKPLSDEGAIYGDLRRTLDELRATVRSIDRLTTELADKPNSLIFGKDPNTKLIPRARR